MLDIQFSTINKTYKPGLFKKKVTALTEVSFSVTTGTVFGLVGPNGAGKSTTIRLLLNLSRPDSGTITVNRAPVTDRDFLRQVGYLPENPYLYDHLTLTELLRFAGAANGLPAAQIAERSALLARQTGIGHAMKRPLRTFSKGMRQRAGLCYALLHDPTLVILDEPMSGLDPLGRKMVCDLILDLKGQGKTVFFCSHILSDVERLCDALAILDRGRLVRTFSDGEMAAFRQGEASLEEAFVAAVSAQAEQGGAA
ncbi:MAG: ABC transporter ATP-binding protein [Trichloromonas sp.]|nr:ABC transporter ATP-binding protein [Trichloromonas sp.]